MQKNLLELVLNFNEFVIFPKEIFTLHELRVLKMTHNEISRIPKEFKQLRNLNILHISNNPIKFIESGLETLNLLNELSLDIIQLFTPLSAYSIPRTPTQSNTQTPKQKLILTQTTSLPVAKFLQILRNHFKHLNSECMGMMEVIKEVIKVENITMPDEEIFNKLTKISKGELMKQAIEAFKPQLQSKSNRSAIFQNCVESTELGA